MPLKPTAGDFCEVYTSFLSFASLSCLDTMTRVLVVSDSMLKDHVGFFTLRPAVSVEVIAFSGIRIEKVFPLVSQKLQGVDILVLHVGECAATRFCRLRTITSKLLDVNPTVRLVLSAILPRQMSLRKNDKWALTPEDLECCNSEAAETNLLLQELCRKGSHLYLDGSGEPWPQLVKLDGVHPNKRGSEVSEMQGNLRTSFVATLY